LKKLGILILLVFIAGFCNGTAWAIKDTLTVGLISDAKTLDPHGTNDTTSSSTMIQMYEPLLEVAADKSLVPVLAESWEQIDPVTYKFYLRKGVKFHNGEPMTADDVIFSLRRMTTPESAPVKLYGDNIDPEGFEKIDDYTFTLKSRGPMAAFLGNLSHTSAYVMNKKAVEAAGENYGNQPVGTGPFKFVSKTKSDRTVMERFDDYWGEKAKAKTLIYRSIPEANSRVIELETGNIDLIYNLPFTEIKRVKEENKVDVILKPGLSLTYIGLNYNAKPFDDLRVRKAISMAIDKEGLNEAVYDGNAAVPVGPLLPKHYYYPKETKPFVYDPEEAKKLLEEAGVPKDFKMTIWTNDNKERIDSATIVQAQLAEVGITCEVQILEWGTFLEKLKSGDLSAFIIGWAAADMNPDPDSWISGPFHSKNAGPSNRVWLNDAEVDSLIEKGKITPDGPEREEIYTKLWNRINDLTGWVYLSIPDSAYAKGKNVKGADNLYRGIINRLDQTYAE
jgi:peptide/nickel transport system substrate-binding protein